MKIQKVGLLLYIQNREQSKHKEAGQMKQIKERNKEITLKPSKLVHKDLIPTEINERVVKWQDLIWLRIWPF